MKKLDEQKWSNFNLVLQLVCIMGALALGNLVSNLLQWEGFIPRLGVYIVMVIIFSPIQAVIKSLAENTPAIRKFFEEK